VGVDWVKVSSLLKNTNRDSLYNSKFNKLTAVNLRELFKRPTLLHGFDNLIKYVIIEEDGTVNLYDYSIPSSGIKNPVCLRITDTNSQIKVLDSYSWLNYGNPNGDARSFNTLGYTFNIPSSLPIKYVTAKRLLIDGKINDTSQINYYHNFPLTNIGFYTNPGGSVWGQYNGLYEGFQNYKDPAIRTIYRHSGSYTPIFRDIELFKVNTLTQSFDNFIFDTELTNFGMSGEIIVSKVNRVKNVLKLANNDFNFSVYPMLDEFGYHTIRKFIFKSTWDYEYHYECIDTDQIDPLQTLTNVTNGSPQQT
jgi:hypothetical protein